MRQTKFTFFIILIVLILVLVFIIVGENDSYNDPANVSIDVSEDVPESKIILSSDEMLELYQNELSDFLYEYQQEVLQQSMTRENAIQAMREKLLDIVQIPKDMQDLHLKLVLAFSRDLNGYIDEAILMYKELENQYAWLFSRFNFLSK